MPVISALDFMFKRGWISFFSLIVTALLPLIAHADWGYEFLHVNCDIAENLFEVREEVLLGVDEMQFEFNEKKRADVVRRYAKEKSLYLVAGYRQKVSCRLSDGTKIVLESIPNREDEHNPFPGAATTLWVNGKQIFRDISFPTDCRRTVESITIDKRRGNSVVITMRTNDDGDRYAEQQPIEGTLDWGKRYDASEDPWLIENCRSDRSRIKQ